jgi:hypothetical protein
MCDDLRHSLRPGYRSFWDFTIRNIKDNIHGIPALKLDGLTLITESGKADAIASKFSLVHDNILQPELSALVQDSCSVLNTFNEGPYHREIKSLIKKLKSGKVSGFDGVSNILLKNIPRRAAVFLTYIFNSCLKLCYFPKQWKHARDHSNPLNYRSINLLSSISKILERIILRRLNVFISGHNALPNH